MKRTGRSLALLSVLLLLTAALPAAAHDNADHAAQDERHDVRRPVVRWRVEQRNRGFLGVHLVRLTDPLRAHFGAPKGVGVMVGEVEPDSPAAKAGIAVGDIIVAVAGTDLGTPQAAARQVARKHGEQVEIKVIRQGKPLTLQATPSERVQRAITRQRWAIGGDADGDEAGELAIEGGDMGELIDSLADEGGAGAEIGVLAQRQAELDQRLKELDEKLDRLDAAIERLDRAKQAR